MFDRYHGTDKIQNIVRAILCEQLPYVGCSADWVNDAWQLYSDDSGDFVIFEHDQEMTYSVYSRDFSGDFYTEIQRFEYPDFMDAREIVADLISKTQKYRG